MAGNNLPGSHARANPATLQLPYTMNGFKYLIQLLFILCQNDFVLLQRSSGGMVNLQPVILYRYDFFARPGKLTTSVVCLMPKQAPVPFIRSPASRFQKNLAIASSFLCAATDVRLIHLAVIGYS
jgi:hypothetical protein